MRKESVRCWWNEIVRGQDASHGIKGASAGLTKRDWLIALGFFALGVSAVLLVIRVRAAAIEEKSMSLRWFEADSPLVLWNMSDRNSDNARAKLHPLFPLVTYPLTSGIRWIGKTSVIDAAWILNAVTAGLWFGTLFIMMRLLDCRLLDSVLLTSLAASSGAGMFWFIVPETYPFGSLTILVALALVALARHRPVPDWSFVVASAASLSITLTNWMAGLISTSVCKPPRRAAMLSLIALATVVVLVFVQKATFPRGGGLFINPRGYGGVKGYLLGAEHGGLINSARVLYLTSVVVPRIELSRFDTQREVSGPMLTIQRSPAGSSGIVGQVATIAWGLLLAAGAVALVAGHGDVRFRIALGVTLLGQSAVYLVFGEETFLYALNCVPLLILAVSLATLTRWRYFVVAVAGLMLPCAAWNNACQLTEALDFPALPTPSQARLDSHTVIHVPNILAVTPLD